MTLEDKIQNRLVADTESILEDNLDRVEKLFQFHSDGTIDIQPQYRDITPQNRIMIYFTAQRFAKEGNISDTDTLDTDFFYERFDRGERTIRNDLQALRESGFISKDGRSSHRIVVENLPKVLTQIEEDVSTND
ncbi:hypothetical protein [Halogranum rubrum]|uniref:hypothetical protein n=1 Tax=Halogranum rubrum TaxID=553466 RepID=UPI001160241D|nr:hypothetical protein [Halogranum rubrum]